jgi:thiol:disulfide interchange protein DsbA
MRFLMALIAIGLSLGASAQGAGQEYVAGQHYEVLGSPVRPSNPARIEVAEVFSYRSAHCFNFEPLLQAWKRKQADDVAVVQIPVVSSPQLESAARAYYTIKALKLEDKVHMEVFKAIFIERRPLDTPEQWAVFLAAYGADKAKVSSVFASFGVSSMLRQAEARIRGYGVTGVPELIVDGRFRISAAALGNAGETLAVASYLIEKVRAERQ